MPQILTIVLLTLMLLCQTGQAQDHPALSLENLQRRLQQLSGDEASQQAAREALTRAITHLQAATADQAALLTLEKRVSDAPATLASRQQALTTLKKQPSEKHIADTSLNKLEQRLTTAEVALAALHQSLNEATTELVGTQTRPERVQAEIRQNQNRLSAISETLNAQGADASKPVEEQRLALLAEKQSLESRNRLLRKELSANNVLRELTRLERDLLSEKINRQEAEIALLQKRVNEGRREASEKTIASLWIDTGDAGDSALLRKENAVNRALSEKLLETTDRLNALTQRSLAVSQQVETLKQSEQALKELVSVLEGSLVLAKILHEQRGSLPEITIASNLSEDIAELRMYQFEVGQQLDAVADPEIYADTLLEEHPQQALQPRIRQQLINIARSRIELIEQLNQELNALLNESINLQLSQLELERTARELRGKLDEQLFWIPSNRPVTGSWLLAVPGQLATQVSNIPWGKIATPVFYALAAHWAYFLPLLLFWAILAARRRWLTHTLRNLNRNVGFVRRDSQWNTPLAIGIHFLYAAPIGLLGATAGIILNNDNRGENPAIGLALIEMALIWMVFYTAYRLLHHRGVAEHHFRWSESTTRFLRRKTVAIGLTSLLLVATATLARQHASALSDDVLGILALSAGYALLTVLLPKLAWYRETSDRLSALRWITGALLAIVPLGLFIAVMFGYYYTALVLTTSLLGSLCLLIVWRILEATLVRGLALAGQRLAYQRMLKKHENTLRDGADSTEIVEEPVLNIDQINQQSLRLMRLALWGIFLVSLYLIWVDLLGVFSYLDNVILYQYASGSGEAQELIPISLQDVLGALLIVVISLMLARNIPGLLEVLFLSRLRLAQGSAYAITTLLSYVIFSIGFIATLGALGVSWNKLQWLVAALSVGLGFGLQEIFANFVSGLIILFEKPVRIGDVVTIGNLSGTVSRIRIRATTITDFDRKEIIVPNKVFVTDQLINWSLSDTVTRVTVKIGVAYGSDLATTRQLLYRVAKENPRVLSDPEPMVFFLSFGASTLDHELRIHVRELADRNPVIDEINRRIDELFREHDIEIAFNQLDVHVRTIDGGKEQALTGNPPQSPPPEPA